MDPVLILIKKAQAQALKDALENALTDEAPTVTVTGEGGAPLEEYVTLSMKAETATALLDMMARGLLDQANFSSSGTVTARSGPRS